MKKSIQSIAAATLLSVASISAQAALILNISDEGAGQTRFEFSGSTIATANMTGGNGMWPEFNAATGPTVSSPGCVSIVSGSGTMTSTLYGTANVNDACIFDSANDDYVTPRTGSTFEWNTGDTLSWSGNMVFDTDYSSFAPGSYSTINSIYGANMFADALIVNVGPQVNVSAPATLSIVGLSLVFLGLRRKK